VKDPATATDLRRAQRELLRDLTPGERIERLAELCKQLAELRRAGKRSS
jgi:ribosomal protein L29